MKQTTKNILGVAAIVLLSSGVAGLTAYKMLQKNTPADSTAAFSDMFQQNPNVRLASYNAVDAQPVDLTQAAENSVHAVVHIKGRIIGTDEVTDLALIKIEGDDFPTIPVGDSDALKVGEWVLAVGNPFNLTSTVTAGIVSAKARSLGMGQQTGTESIESYIQTDAAINQGNSGGALVNARGELVGINAALFSPTGSNTGYGFAIPTSIMKKVVADLKQFGTVQRVKLGVAVTPLVEEPGDTQRPVDKSGKKLSEFKKEAREKSGVVDGLLVGEIVEGSSAAGADIKVDDVLIGIDDKPIHKFADLQEALAKHRPGDKVKVK